MNNINKRFNFLLDYIGLSNPVLERHTGIKSTIWANVRNGKSRVNEDHLEAVNKMWPQYTYWITTGMTLPEAGQISPEIEETRKNLSTGT
ncbi:MAG: DNA-binding protein [Methylobacter sp.]